MISMGERNIFDNVQYIGKTDEVKKAEEFIKSLPISLNAEGCMIDARTNGRNLHIYPFGIYDNAEVMIPDKEQPNKFLVEYSSIIFKKEGDRSVPYVRYRIDYTPEEKKPPYGSVVIRLQEFSDIQFL